MSASTSIKQMDQDTVAVNSAPDLKQTSQTLDAETIKAVRERAEAPYIAEIKGLASLQDATYSVDLEKTVHDMAEIINNMESQLDKVLSINTVLEDDLNATKQIISDLREEKKKITDELKELKAEMPTLREMQMEVDQLVDERSLSQNKIHGLNADIAGLKGTVEKLNKQILQLEMEKNDAISEVNFLETRQVAARQQNNNQQIKINQLKSDKINLQKKIIVLQDECQRAMEEKYSLLRELQEAQDILSEVSRP